MMVDCEQFINLFIHEYAQCVVCEHACSLVPRPEEEE